VKANFDSDICEWLYVQILICDQAVALKRRGVLGWIIAFYYRWCSTLSIEPIPRWWVLAVLSRCVRPTGLVPSATARSASIPSSVITLSTNIRLLLEQNLQVKVITVCESYEKTWNGLVLRRLAMTAGVYVRELAVHARNYSFSYFTIQNNRKLYK
jgi:hypothetical protein